MKHIIRRARLGLTLLFALMATTIQAEEAQGLKLQIAEPYLEIHTGPGRAYPVFHVMEKGEWIVVSIRRTSWYKVTSVNDNPQRVVEGWVSHDEIALTLTEQNQQVVLPAHTFDDYTQRDFELGAMVGELDGTSSFSAYGGWIFSDNLSMELSYTQALGDFAENELFMINLLNRPFPDWTVSPFFSLGLGQIKTSPRSNLVESGDASRDDDLASVGGGASYYLTRNFILRLEYRNYVALTDRDENEEFDEWKIGFAVFF